MPATAAIDNETLDHLLSVVNDGNHYSGDFLIRKRAAGYGIAAVFLRVQGGVLFPLAFH